MRHGKRYNLALCLRVTSWMTAYTVAFACQPARHICYGARKRIPRAAGFI